MLQFHIHHTHKAALHSEFSAFFTIKVLWLLLTSHIIASSASCSSGQFAPVPGAL